LAGPRQNRFRRYESLTYNKAGTGALDGRGKNGGNGGFSGGKSAIFPCLEPWRLNTSHWLGRFYVG
jgi:hypothetical protein